MSNRTTEQSAAPPSLKKSSSSSKNQTSIAGFFKRKGPETMTGGTPKINGSALPMHRSPKKNGVDKPTRFLNHSLTPAPSSDAAEEVKEEDNDAKPARLDGNPTPNGLPSPITPASAIGVGDGAVDDIAPKGFYSPSRKVNSTLLFFERLY